MTVTDQELRVLASIILKLSEPDRVRLMTTVMHDSMRDADNNFIVGRAKCTTSGEPLVFLAGRGDAAQTLLAMERRLDDRQDPLAPFRQIAFGDVEDVY